MFSERGRFCVLWHYYNLQKKKDEQLPGRSKRGFFGGLSWCCSACSVVTSRCFSSVLRFSKLPFSVSVTRWGEERFSPTVWRMFVSWGGDIPLSADIGVQDSVVATSFFTLWSVMRAWDILRNRAAIALDLFLFPVGSIPDCLTATCSVHGYTRL